MNKSSWLSFKCSASNLRDGMKFYIYKRPFFPSDKTTVEPQHGRVLKFIAYNKIIEMKFICGILNNILEFERISIF